jgi:hypothetical protein
MRGITRHRYAGHTYLRINYNSNNWARELPRSDGYPERVLPRTDHVLVYEETSYIRDADNNLVMEEATRNYLVRPLAGSTYESILQRLGLDRSQLNAAIAAVQGPPEYHRRRPMSNSNRDRLAARAQQTRVSTARIRELIESGVTPEATRQSQVETPEYSRPAARAAHLAFLAGGQ